MSSKSFDYEGLSKSILTEHNRIRQDPQSYIPILKQYLKYFKGDVIYKPKEVPVQTYEGPAVYEEAIAFLKKQKPVEALTFDERITKAAEDHVRDIGPKGLLSHDSTDGKTMSDRVEVYVEWDSSCGENIELGSKTGQDVIISLLVDDGVQDRGHRKNLFKSDFFYMGIACGPHRECETITVIDYIGGLRDKGKPFFDYSNFKYEYPQELQTGFSKPTPKKKENKPKTAFQLQDEDAPDGTVSVKIMKKTKLFNGKLVSVTKKYYTLEDGTQHIVEVEEF